MQRRIAVNPVDNIIVVEGVARTVLFSVSDNIRAVQWDGKQGHIEYADDSVRVLSPANYAAYVQPFVAVWEDACHSDKQRMNASQRLYLAKEQEIIAQADAAMRAFNSRYSHCEEETWPMQEAGARIIEGCEERTQHRSSVFILSQERLRNEAVAMVEALAAGRGIPPQTLAQTIIARADRAAWYRRHIFSEQCAFQEKLKKIASMDGEALAEHAEGLAEDSETAMTSALESFIVAYTGGEDFESSMADGLRKTPAIEEASP